jgi:hypothetical protein
VRRFAKLDPMSLGREPPRDPLEVARDRLLRDLNVAVGTNLSRAISEGREYLHHYPHDEVVAEALTRAQRHLRESNTSG